MKSFWIHTYGCQMNAHESDKLRGMLARAGFVQGAGPDTADIVIFQTCSIRDTAARKTLTHISQAKKERIKNKRKQIICVIGCLSAHKQIPGVDIVLGTNQLEVLVQKLTTKDVSDEKFSRPVGRGRGADRPRFGNFETDTSLVVSSVIITHGCGNFCSYCIVPYVRGPEYSRDIEEIVAD
ncbi:MAG: hypothetical protein LBG88_03790, partial [Christensenellaceae bacterium]|nr:hypothetical protein [Christensenellaceae bacterium]